jgi:peptide/nickel transport system permease protein
MLLDPNLTPALEAPVLATREAWRTRIRTSLLSSTGLAGVVLAVIVLLCLIAPWIVRSPLALDLPHRLSAPSALHPLGADSLGRDILARILNGGRLDLTIAGTAASLSLLVGGSIGILLGYFRGPVSEILMRVLDVQQAFPLLVLALALLAFVGAHTSTFIFALAFVNIPIFIRLVRSETLTVRGLPYVEAAEAVGNPTGRIITRYVLPNVITSGLIHVTTAAGQAVLTVGALGFLGVGIRPPDPEWGSMIQDGSQFLITGQWWVALSPAAFMVLTVMSLNTLGEGFVRSRRVR